MFGTKRVLSCVIRREGKWLPHCECFGSPSLGCSGVFHKGIHLFLFNQGSGERG